jgi:two-component system OmpR family sensor kinase
MPQAKAARPGNRMLDSIRVRLTLWYTLVLAFVLVLLAVFTYFVYRRNISQRTDSNLTELSDAFATTFTAELADTNGSDAPKAAARQAVQEHRFRDTVFVVLDSSGAVLLSSLDLPQVGTPKEHIDSAIFSTESFRALASQATSRAVMKGKIPGGKGGFRAVTRLIATTSGNYGLVVLQSLHPQREMLEDILRTFYWTIPFALLLAGLGGYFLARKSLAPVAAMASQARGMGAANLHDRLAIANSRDELGQLALSFNQLLERLEASFEQQRRFVADASHELRTPVAILRGEAEVTLSKPDRSPAEYRETLAILRDESQRLAHIIEDLFTLTRADAGQYPLSLRDSYLDELASEALVRARSLALAKNITLTSSIESNLPVHADETLLGRMLLNLLENAIKYSPRDSSVELSCRREGDHYLVGVSDHGPGIPEDLQSRIFERFFRADKARLRSQSDTGGAGLGLSIARWIAEAHNGRLELTLSNASGSTFSILLPAPKKQESQKPN